MNRARALLAAAASLLLLLIAGRAHAQIYPSAGVYYQDGNGIAVALYRSAIDVKRQFGARGDGITDDTPAIDAAINFGLAHPGFPLYFQPTGNCYCLSHPEPIGPGQTWLGDNANSPAAQSSCLKACAPMEEVLFTHTTASAATGATPSRVVGLVIDANHMATYGELREGDWLNLRERDLYVNAIVAGVASAGHRLPITLSGYSQSIGGGSPSMSLASISQPDPHYSAFLAATNVCAKVIAGGTLASGAATYSFSTDGGASYPSFTQAIASPSNACLASGSVCVRASGNQIAFVPGLYAPGDSYCWTLTVQTEDVQPVPINAEARFRDTWIIGAGTVYWSAGQGGFANAASAGSILSPGTVSTTVSSQIITGASTTILSGAPTPIQQPRSGDQFFVSGAGLFTIACALDDRHVATVSTLVPNANVSGAGYAFSNGACFWEDFAADGARLSVDGGRVSNCPMGMRLVGKADGGPTVSQTRIENYAFSGVSLGDVQGGSQGSLFSNLEMKVPPTGGARIWLGPAVSLSLIEPRQQFVYSDIAGGGTGIAWLNGNMWPIGGTGTSMVPLQTEQHVVTVLTITAATQVIPCPATTPAANFTSSLLELTATGVVTMSSATPIAPPATCGTGQDGTDFVLANIGANAITFPNAGNNLDSSSAVTLGQWQSMHVYSKGGRWRHQELH